MDLFTKKKKYMLIQDIEGREGINSQWEVK